MILSPSPDLDELIQRTILSGNNKDTNPSNHSPTSEESNNMTSSDFVDVVDDGDPADNDKESPTFKGNGNRFHGLPTFDISFEENSPTQFSMDENTYDSNDENSPDLEDTPLCDLIEEEENFKNTNKRPKFDKPQLSIISSNQNSSDKNTSESSSKYTDDSTNPYAILEDECFSEKNENIEGKINGEYSSLTDSFNCLIESQELSLNSSTDVHALPVENSSIPYEDVSTNKDCASCNELSLSQSSLVDQDVSKNLEISEESVDETCAGHLKRFKESVQIVSISNAESIESLASTIPLQNQVTSTMNDPTSFMEDQYQTINTDSDEEASIDSAELDSTSNAPTESESPAVTTTGCNGSDRTQLISYVDIFESSVIEQIVTDATSNEQRENHTVQLLEIIDAKINLHEDAIEKLKENFSNVHPAPIYILSVAGNARLGKSTFHNLFLVTADKNAKGLFATGSQMNSLTRGLWIYSYPVRFKDGFALLVDCEGMDLCDEHSSGILYLFAMLFSSTFTIHDTKTLHNKTLTQLAYSLQLLHEIPHAEELLPNVIFVIRDTKTLKWNEHDTNDAILKGILNDLTNPHISIIDKCLHQKYLTHLPSPTTIIDSHNPQDFYNSVKDSDFYQYFKKHVYGELKSLSQPKCHTGSSYPMTIDEIVSDLFKIRDLFNDECIEKLPSVLELHITQKFENKVQEFEDEFEAYARSLVISNVNISSVSLEEKLRSKQEELLYSFKSFATMFENGSQGMEYYNQLYKRMSHLSSSFTEKRQKIEMQALLKKEREYKIKLDLDRFKEDKRLKAERKKRREEETSRRSSKQNDLSDSGTLSFNETDPIIQPYNDNVKWKNTGVLLKSNVRCINIGSEFKEGLYHLLIRNTTDSRQMISSGRIESELMVNNEKIIPEEVSKREIIYELRLRSTDVLSLKLRSQPEHGWRSWIPISGGTLSYKVTLEYESAM